jgi:hypothetical protein
LEAAEPEGLPAETKHAASAVLLLLQAARLYSVTTSAHANPGEMPGFVPRPSKGMPHYSHPLPEKQNDQHSVQQMLNLYLITYMFELLVVYLMALSVFRLRLLWGEMDFDTEMRKI